MFRAEKKKIVKKIKDIEGFLELNFLEEAIQKRRKKKKLFKRAELGYRYGKLVFRLVNEFNPRSISFYGLTFGLNLLYLALSNKKISVDFFQSGNFLRRICQNFLEEAGVLNVRYLEDKEPIDVNHEFVFINSSLFPDKIEKLINANINSSCDNSVMIIKGIHETKKMEIVWEDVVMKSEVRISLDLFEIGILLFRRSLQKEHFVLKF